MKAVCLCANSSNFANVNDSSGAYANYNNASNASGGVRPLCNLAGLCVG